MKNSSAISSAFPPCSASSSEDATVALSPGTTGLSSQSSVRNTRPLPACEEPVPPPLPARAAFAPRWLPPPSGAGVFLGLPGPLLTVAAVAVKS